VLAQVKAIDIFEVLSKTRTRSRGKIDFVLVFQHKFKHLVDKVHDQLEATGLTIQQVQFPILAPKKYMILVSCMSNVIAKYAEDIGFEKKLVLTEDRSVGCQTCGCAWCPCVLICHLVLLPQVAVPCPRAVDV